LQLQTVQNQLQPHFTFNVLNTIGSMIYKNEKDEAYEYLNYFSDMLRSTLLSSNRPNWQIGEELSFISSYMDMENLRFENKFNYTQSITEGTDLSKLVPKLTIQAFVENAVRHGLMHKQEDCKLAVSILHTADHLVIEVEDNGIGREAAAKLPRQQNGLGNEILDEYINIYNKTSNMKFKLHIEDLLAEDGSGVGTRVYFMVPLDFKPSNP
jgi:LytS/YehU family sensor histidine kinase